MDIGIIEQATKVDIIAFLLTLLLLMAAVIVFVKVVEQFSKIIKKPVWWINKKNEDHEAIVNLKTELDSHRSNMNTKIEQLNNTDVEIKSDIAELHRGLNKLTDMFVNKEISDMRFDIVDVASAITLGREYSVEQLAHVMRIHDDYERILRERNLTNGQVDMSIEVIKAEYRRLTRPHVSDEEE